MAGCRLEYSREWHTLATLDFAEKSMTADDGAKQQMGTFKERRDLEP